MRKGFTLIELLVVIAIIAILAAILFPVFVKAKEAANTTKCGAHGKQIGTAMLMYLDDNNGRFPSSLIAWPSSDSSDKAVPGSPRDQAEQYLGSITWRYDWPGNVGNTQPNCNIWQAGEFQYLFLFKYLKNQDVWVCPSPNGLYSLKCALGYRDSWSFLIYDFTCGYNGAYPDTAFQTEKKHMGDPVDGIGRTMSEVQALDSGHWHRYMPPTKKIFAFCYALGGDVSLRTETYKGSTGREPPLFPHNEGTIYVYFDGHAKWAETGCGWAPAGYTPAGSTTPYIDRAHPRG